LRFRTLHNGIVGDKNPEANRTPHGNREKHETCDSGNIP
jgi:hypothetical protein